MGILLRAELSKLWSFSLSCTTLYTAWKQHYPFVHFFSLVFHIFIASLIHILQQWSGSLPNKFLHIRHCNAFFFFWEISPWLVAVWKDYLLGGHIPSFSYLIHLLEISLHFCLAGYPVSSVSCLSGFTPLFWWSTSSSDFPWKDVSEVNVLRPSISETVCIFLPNPWLTVELGF